MRWDKASLWTACRPLSCCGERKALKAIWPFVPEAVLHQPSAFILYDTVSEFEKTLLYMHSHSCLLLALRARAQPSASAVFGSLRSPAAAGIYGELRRAQLPPVEPSPSHPFDKLRVNYPLLFDNSLSLFISPRMSASFFALLHP